MIQRECSSKYGYCTIGSTNSSSRPRCIRSPGEPTERLYRKGFCGLRQMAHKFHKNVRHGPAWVRVAPLPLAPLVLQMLVFQGRVLLQIQVPKASASRLQIRRDHTSCQLKGPADSKVVQYVVLGETCACSYTETNAKCPQKYRAESDRPHIRVSTDNTHQSLVVLRCGVG